MNKPALTLDSTYDEFLAVMPEGKLKRMLSEDGRRKDIKAVRDIIVWIVPTMAKPSRDRLYKVLAENGLESVVPSQSSGQQL